jgi:S-adenosylmethionine-diacylglycerol 3-amino-3-carboxypropyl transferase
MSAGGRPEYANVWEDAALELDFLRPRAGVRALCVTSGGCTALALARGGARVLAVDMSFSQTAMLELKLHALHALPMLAAHDFLGARRLGEASRSVDRAEIYRSIAERLTPEVRHYWDRHGAWIRRGVLDQGSTEVFMTWFRRAYHWSVHGRSSCERWFALRDERDRRAWFHEHWDTRRRRAFMHLAVSPRLLGRVYKTASVYSSVGSAADVLRKRLDTAMLERPVEDNYFLSRLFTGCFLPGPRGVPPYLAEEEAAHSSSFDPARVETRTESLFTVLERAQPASLDLFALSNVVDWMDGAQQTRLFELVAKAGAPGARLMIRSVFSAWQPPSSVAPRLSDLESPAALLAKERSIVYGAVHAYRLES